MSFTGSTLLTFVVRAALVVSSLARSILLARLLGPDGVGVVALLVVLSASCFRLGNLGFGPAIAYFVARKDIRPADGWAVAWRVGLGASLLSLLVIFLFRGSRFFPWGDVGTDLILWYLPAVPLYFVNTFIKRTLGGELRIPAVNAGDVIHESSLLICLFTFMVVLRRGLVGACAAFSAAGFIEFAYLISLRPAAAKGPRRAARRQALNVPMVREMWRFGRWNYLVAWSGFWASELPVLLLKVTTGSNRTVGIFSRALTLGMQVRLAIEPITMNLFPYTASSEEEVATRRTNVLCRTAGLASILVLLLVCPFVDDLILLMYGSAFAPAVPMFYSLVPGLCALPICHLIGIHLLAIGHPRNLFLADVAALAVSVPICCVAIVLYGAIGAGLGASAIWLALTACRLWYYRKVTGAALQAVLLPRRSDLVFFRHLAARSAKGLHARASASFRR